VRAPPSTALTALTRWWHGGLTTAAHCECSLQQLLGCQEWRLWIGANKQKAGSLKWAALVQASLASGVVDICLIPEVSFDLTGEQGMLAYVGDVLKRKGHVVICVAEGAGQVRSGLAPCHACCCTAAAGCTSASHPRPRIFGTYYFSQLSALRYS
jgi:hypothetical protein